MRFQAVLVWLLAFGAYAETEVEAVRKVLDRAEAALSSPRLDQQERQLLKSKLDDAEKALAAYVKLKSRGDKREAATAPLYVAGGALLADDVTGVGAADDPLLPIIALGLLVAHATTPRPATESELSRAWGALMTSLDAAAATAKELSARKKKPGCYCRCFKRGDSSPLPLERVATPDVCAEKCREYKGIKFTGYECGGGVVWF